MKMWILFVPGVVEMDGQLLDSLQDGNELSDQAEGGAHRQLLTDHDQALLLQPLGFLHQLSLLCAQRSS